ncbi:DUF1214 domain-containing protein [Salinispora mooreana]|uniref:DUF1214 domain-containing protein n=2 Tax=Salinispora mooreana TaxID=999545 RepID=UPI0009B784F0|nr:DUF1214 domain-containing protein [Salinispora mooreana]
MTRLIRSLCASLCAAGILLATPSYTTARSPSPDGAAIDGQTAHVYEVTRRYVTKFYPRWFTHQQQRVLVPNLLFGPDEMSPTFRSVVAPSDDTLYTSALIGVRHEPAILEIPDTAATYGVLITDVYGNIINTDISTTSGGTYAFTGPGWSGSLPPEVAQIALPVTNPLLIIRTNRFSSEGENQSALAEEFRRSLRMGPLLAYERGVLAETLILPVTFWARSFKRDAGRLIRNNPIRFLRELQRGVRDIRTPPLTGDNRELADEFDKLLATGRFDEEFARATQDAQSAIIANYLDNTDQNNWINFRNIGFWGREYLDRSSIAEFCQYCNGIDSSAYYNVFQGEDDRPLNGASGGYVLTFERDQIPQSRDFWSVTSYISETINLHRNPEDKYVVASYTPGLETNEDGSISIYATPTPPPGVSTANWLPVPDGPFSMLLRVYSPEGSVADGTYVPPAVREINQPERNEGAPRGGG